MKGDTEVILFIVFFLAGGLVIGLIEEKTYFEFFSLLIPATTTLFAAYFGAKYAFDLQNKRNDEEKVRYNVEAANNLIFQLIRIYGKFRNVRDQFIEEHRDSPARHLMIMPVGGLRESDDEFDFDRLGFMFKSSNPNIVVSISSLDLELIATTDTILRRSAMHFDVIQPKIEEAENANGRNLTIDELEGVLGLRTVTQLTMLTDFMVEGVDGVLELTQSILKELSTILPEMYPGHSFLKMINLPEEREGVA